MALEPKSPKALVGVASAARRTAERRRGIFIFGCVLVVVGRRRRRGWGGLSHFPESQRPFIPTKLFLVHRKKDKENEPFKLRKVNY